MSVKMKQHVQIVAWLHIVFGGLGVLIGMFLFSLMTGLGLAVDDPEANTVMPIIGTVLGYFLVAVSAPDIIAGIFLLKYKNWARYLAIIIAFFDLLLFPIGTIIAIYVLWVLFNEDTARLFREQEETAVMEPQQT